MNSLIKIAVFIVCIIKMFYVLSTYSLNEICMFVYYLLHNLVHTGKPDYIVLKSEIMSRHMGKPTICIGENKDADQLCSNCEADQHLCFRYTDSTIPLLHKSKISSF